MLNKNIMKAKVIALIAISTIIATSFAFTTTHKDNKKTEKISKEANQESEPIGGFVFEDKF